MDDPLQPCQASIINIFANIANNFYSLTIFRKKITSNLPGHRTKIERV